MKTVEDLTRAFGVYFGEMERCENAGTYWALLHLVLVLPDICAALESDPSAKVGTRYIDWCAKHFPVSSRVTAADRYQMRNAVLHEGTTLPTNRAADKRQHTQYSSFSFVDPRFVGVEVHQNISPDGSNLTIDVKSLADETRQALRHWFDALQKDASLNARVEHNLSRLARAQPKVSHVPAPATPGGFNVIRHITTSST